MNVFVFDVEADGLLEHATKLHTLCAHDPNGNRDYRLVDYDDIRLFLSNADVLIGHNIVRYDVPLLEKLLGIKIKAKLVDTLPLSWYLEPERLVHGLEEWGEEFGIQKPPIDDWTNLSPKEYIHRCSEDVKINTKLWKRFKNHLTVLYGDWEKAKPLVEYLSFKMDCAREQERSKWKLDKPYALKSLQELQEAREEKRARLVAAMPSVPVYAQRRPPSKPFKKDGTYSVQGAKWFALLEKNKLPKNYTGDIKELVGEKPPNPGSSGQVKDWLYSLGWKPETFKYTRDKDTGDVKKTEQVNLEHGGGLCPSVLRLIPDNPQLSALDELGVVSHRIGLLNGFIADADNDNYIKAEIAGLTNTLRFKHKTIVNLPKVNAKYGEQIRGCLIAPDGYELCGSDMSSLEDRLKQHFIYPHDPAYVEEMNVEDYDPHLSLALLAGEVNELQISDYKSGTNKAIKPIRDIFKNGNYACQYGAGPPRLALTANISLKKAKQVWETYWKKNWAIKVVASEQTIKTVRGQMWLFNPISKFWYSLRYEKDIFSTLVQGSASYVFDEWVRLFRSKRPQITGQFHDEVVLTIKKGFREQAIDLLNSAILELNNILQLNRELGIGTQFGDRYSEIH
jgi:hypothetical protein